MKLFPTHIGWGFLLGWAFLGGCASSTNLFPSLGTGLASPSGLAVDSTARRLYVSNSNSEVAFDWREGSFQALDITNPRAPKLLTTLATPSFSGKIYLDTTNKRAFVPNRFNAGPEVTQDQLFTITLNEAAGFQLTSTSVHLDPFAVACCVPDNRLLFTTSQGILQHVDISVSPLQPKDINLLVSLSTGGTIGQGQAALLDVVIIGHQAFASRALGGVFVINLDQIDNSNTNPVDYFISDIHSPRGMAVSGTTLLVTDEDTVNGKLTDRVLIINPAPLTPLGVHQTVTVKSKDKDAVSLVAAAPAVGKNPQQMIVAAGKVFVANADDNTISVIDLSSNTVTTTIGVGTKPFGLAVDSPGGVPTTLYVGNLVGDTLSIIDIPSLTIVGAYP